MDFKDYYKALGVARSASAAEIKQAFRKLARRHHPDVSKLADASERMVALNEAHAVLSDPGRRAAYDTLANEATTRDGHGFSPPPNWDASFAFSGVPGDVDTQAHSDFFEQLFGRAARVRRADQGGTGGESPSMRGSDHHAQIELDLLDAYTGANRTITLQGDAVRHLQVRIPKGVHEGQYIRLAGRGGAGSGHAPAGDLLLDVMFKPDARWRAEGRDVYQRLSLAPWEAMLGARVTVHTPTGETEVTIPAGWQAGRKLRLKGSGIPGAGSHGPGNLYIELALALPPADSDGARAAYLAMAQAFPTFSHASAKESEHASR
jgi:curved DNA-binding protein